MLCNGFWITRKPMTMLLGLYSSTLGGSAIMSVIGSCSATQSLPMLNYQWRPLGFFKITRRLTQGSPLPLSPFFLVMEAFNRSGLRAKEVYIFEGLSVDNNDNRMEIIHFMFANYILLLLKPNKEVLKIKYVLLSY